MKAFLSTIFLFLSICAFSQIDYDILISESFDNSTNLTVGGATGFGGTTSGTCGSNNVFDVNAETGDPSDMPSCIYYESVSFFRCC